MHVRRVGDGRVQRWDFRGSPALVGLPPQREQEGRERRDPVPRIPRTSRDHRWRVHLVPHAHDAGDRTLLLPSSPPTRSCAPTDRTCSPHGRWRRAPGLSSTTGAASGTTSPSIPSPRCAPQQPRFDGPEKSPVLLFAEHRTRTLREGTKRRELYGVSAGSLLRLVDGGASKTWELIGSRLFPMNEERLGSFFSFAGLPSTSAPERARCCA